MSDIALQVGIPIVSALFLAVGWILRWVWISTTDRITRLEQKVEKLSEHPSLLENKLDEIIKELRDFE